jgi:glycerate 2-kinase
MSPAPTPTLLRDHAVAIWQAGVEAVRAETLVDAAVDCNNGQLRIVDQLLPLDSFRRIAVVGAGKAGAGMAAGLEQALGDQLLSRISGWVNVPADCLRPLRVVHLHAARPAGVNEPTAEGVAGTERILQIVGTLHPDDLCIVLLSGGGSALLPAPVSEISLDDKQSITRSLSRAGASIEELNCVRKQLSRVKGGRLAAACTARKLISLIISDVMGDPLDVIASGPTVPDFSSPADALAVLESYSGRIDVPQSIPRYLKRAGSRQPPTLGHRQVANFVIGNIDRALAAATEHACRLGYTVESLGGNNGGIARDVGVELAERCLTLRDVTDEPTCLLSGGEPTVQLAATDQPRKGGRNQELILAAAQRLWDEDLALMVLLSGGTDGEDGTTDAAGAIVDRDVMARARCLSLHPAGFLSINNSYPFFDQTGGLLRTGPTHTNVMDVRVGLVRPPL